MMKSIRFLLIALPLLSSNLFGQCNPHPMKPSLLPPCATILDKLSEAMDAMQEFQRLSAKATKEIGDARARYWNLFPDRPGVDEAELAYLKQLRDKDLFYLAVALPQGVTGFSAKAPNYMMLNMDSTEEDIKGFAHNIDNGPRPYAFPLFAEWVTALRRNSGRMHDEDWASPVLLAKAYQGAFQNHSGWAMAYIDARDWAEFMSSGLDLAKYVTPKEYIVNQMEADVALVEARSKPEELPDARQATVALYGQFEKMFGEKAVLAAAGSALHARKNAMGGLAPRVQYDIGMFSTGTSPNPVMLFLTELTKSSPRAYAITLCLDANYMMRDEAPYTFMTKERWENAYDTYTKVVAKFGEANVLAAAARLREEPKNGDDLSGDLQGKSTQYWFTVLLKDPKAGLPESYAFRAASYDPHWLGKSIKVVGTVDHVDLDKDKFPPYATIHFVESKKLTVFTPNSDMWQQGYGDNFQNLVGQPIEVEGEATDWRDAAGIRVLTFRQLRVIDRAELANFKESHPHWENTPMPKENLVESPKYLAWKNFPVGSKATYRVRTLTETAPGSNRYNVLTEMTNTFELVSLDADKAVVRIKVDGGGKAGYQVHSTTDMTYRAKEPSAPNQNPSFIPSNESPVKSSGDDVLTISGKSVPTKWESIASSSNPASFQKTYSSGQVPGGMVLQHTQQEGGPRARVEGGRMVSQTIWEPVPGADPVVTFASGKEPGADTAAAPQSARAASGTAMRPMAGTSPGTSGQTGTAEVLDYTQSQADTRGAAANGDSQPARVPMPTMDLRRARQNDPSVTLQVPQNTSSMTPEQRYQADTLRISRARTALSQKMMAERGTLATLPDNVRTAYTQMNLQMRDVTMSMRTHDAALESRFQELEQTLSVLESYLGMKPAN